MKKQTEGVAAARAATAAKARAANARAAGRRSWLRIGGTGAALAGVGGWATLAPAIAATDGGAAPAARMPGGMKVLVGFPPGGTTDVLGRLVARELAELFRTTAVVDNRPGASGGIAAAAVARSQADGSTLLFVSSTHATNPSLYASLPYDTERDFVPIGLVATTPYVLTAHPDLGVRDLAGLVKYLKDKPGTVNYASASPGTGQHLAGELFGRMAGVDIVHVPYKGSSAALPDVLSGRIQTMFENVAVMTPQIKLGSLVPIAVTGPKRSRLLPEVPTIAESGLSGFEVLGWFAVLAPAGTPPDVVTGLNAALQRVIALPAFSARLDALGADPVGGSPGDCRAFIAGEIAKWRDVIRSAGIAPS